MTFLRSPDLLTHPVLKKYCCGGDDFLSIDATTEVLKLTLYINKITGYFDVTEQLMISFMFIRDQSYVVAVCCTPGIDAITQTLFISDSSSVLRFISKFVLLTQSTPAVFHVNMCPC